jgi:hypothetical protein
MDTEGSPNSPASLPSLLLLLLPSLLPPSLLLLLLLPLVLPAAVLEVFVATLLGA